MAGNPSTNQWSSNWGFLFAAIGFAVGLGNIWRFPYITGVNGGSAFLIVYLACVICVGLPLLIAELSIGRRGRCSPTGSMKKVAQESGVSSRWSGVGTLAVFCVFILLSIYAIITGWTFDYFLRSATGEFSGIDMVRSGEIFGSLLSSPGRLLFWHTLVCVFVIVVVRQGVQKGIERASKVLMPMLVMALALMTVYSLVTGDASATVKFLFEPDFSKLGFDALMVAIGQAFFSIGIGVAGMITFGSYLPDSTSIPRSAMIIVLADVGVALMAGLVIFPLVFSFGLETTSGPGLIFQTLPIAFGQMPAGEWFGALFFVLLISAALTSCIGCGEALISWVEEHWNVDRKRGVLLSVGAAWALGIISILSLNVWSDVYFLDFIPVFEGKAFFALLEFVASNILLLTGGLLVSIFCGWVVPKMVSKSATGIENGALYTFWHFMIRFVIPPVLMISILLGISE